MRRTAASATASVAGEFDVIEVIELTVMRPFAGLRPCAPQHVEAFGEDVAERSNGMPNGKYSSAS